MLNEFWLTFCSLTLLVLLLAWAGLGVAVWLAVAVARDWLGLRV